MGAVAATNTKEMRRMRAEHDTRMPPWRWRLLAGMMPLAFGAACLVTRSWTPLQDGWPIIVVVFLLAAIRQGADLYERRQGWRRHAPHA